MNKKTLSRGVLLINVGTPDLPTTKSVRIYLKQFLSDKRIIDIFWLFRFLIVRCFILPIRSKKSAKLYKNIWTEEGSPLLSFSKQCAQKLSDELGEEYKVAIAMGYGNPSLDAGLKELQKNSVEHITFVPLFPQYAASTTGSVIEAISKKMSQNWHIPTYNIVKPFFQNSHFIAAQTERILAVLKDKKPDFFLFSYHGLPIRHLEKSKNYFPNSTCLSQSNCCESLKKSNHFCYRAQCFETTRLIVESAQLSKEQYCVAFQSRFGKSKWTQPDTQDLLVDLYKSGIRRLVVVCPGFVVDCLETLEEIGIRLKEDWLALGGSELILLESLNDNQNWILCLKDLIQT